MKTFILGWDNEGAHGTAVLVCSPQSSQADQIQVFQDAKKLHKFPKGIKCLKRYTAQELEQAVFVSDELTKDFEAKEKTRVEAEKKSKSEKEAKAKAEKDLADAKLAVQKAVGERNKLIGRKNSIEVRLRNITLAVSAGLANADKSEQEKLKKELSELPEQITKAEKEFETAQTNLAKLQTPTEQKQSANKNTVNF